jgi:hypothetical protein
VIASNKLTGNVKHHLLPDRNSQNFNFKLLQNKNIIKYGSSYHERGHGFFLKSLFAVRPHCNQVGFTIIYLGLMLRIEHKQQALSLLGPCINYKENDALRKKPLGPYSQYWIFPQLKNGPRKLDRFIRYCWKGLPGTITIAYWAHKF